MFTYRRRQVWICNYSTKHKPASAGTLCGEFSIRYNQGREEDGPTDCGRAGNIYRGAGGALKLSGPPGNRLKMDTDHEQ